MLGDTEKINLINSLTAYQNAVDAAAIVSITDKAGSIVFANDLFCEISGYSRDELIGQNHRIINSGIHPKEFFSQLWKQISAGHIWRGEIKNKSKNGQFYWVDTTISPILDNEGNILQYLSIRSLITERKTLEYEKELLLGELTHKYNDLMQFNYIVSHNIRAPTANIFSLSEMLLAECSDCPADVVEYIHHISQSASSLIGVINDLNDILSVNKSGQQQKEPFILSSVLDSVLRSLEKEIADSRAKIVVKGGEVDYELLSIKSYINSILFNLVNNAIKYRKSGSELFIDIKFERVNGTILIAVSDNGIGMDMEKIGPEIFKLYKRFDFKTEGKGLGLYMTKVQVTALGGRIEVKSAPGAGTKFLVYIPLN